MYAFTSWAAMSSFEEYEEEAKDCIAKATKATSEANAAVVLAHAIV